MTELKKKKNEAYLLCEHVFSPAVSGGEKVRKPLDAYRNSAHTWMCTRISWQESEVVLEMLLSGCDGMLRTPHLLLDTRAKQYTLLWLESISF